jgi:hypothetical protein
VQRTIRAPSLLAGVTHQPSKVRGCQKCHKPLVLPFGAFVTPLVSVFGELHALPWECRDECPGAIPVIVCHDEVVVKCDAEQAANAKAWVEEAMIEGMDAVLNSASQTNVPVGVESRVASSWRENDTEDGTTILGCAAGRRQRVRITSSEGSGKKCWRCAEKKLEERRHTTRDTCNQLTQQHWNHFP